MLKLQSKLLIWTKRLDCKQAGPQKVQVECGRILLASTGKLEHYQQLQADGPLGPCCEHKGRPYTCTLLRRSSEQVTYIPTGVLASLTS